MSGFVAKWNAGDKPIDPSEIEAFSFALAHRGAKGTRHWVGNGVLIVSHLSTDDGSEFYAGTSTSGHDLVVALDGCVDNHTDLAKKLKIAPSASVSQLVASAFDVWKEDAFALLLGPVSFVLWDGSRKTLFCVHDVVGEKPVYYHLDQGRTFVCGSEISGVLADASVPRRVNDAHLAGYIACRLASPTSSIFQSVNRLQPAQVLSVSNEQFRQSRYFDFDLDAQIKYSSDREYAEHFRQLFSDVVLSQIPPGDSFATELSGGIDSSFLTGTLGQLLRANRISGSLTTLSQVFPGMDCDESPFIQDVVKQWDARPLFVHSLDHRVFDFADQAKRHRDLPYAAQFSTAVASHRRARSEGIDTVFSGIGSDEIFHGSTNHWQDVIRSGKWWRLFATRTSYGQPEQRGLARTLAKSLLPADWVKNVRGKRAASVRNDSAYFRPSLFDAMETEQPLAVRAKPGPFRSHAQRSILKTLNAPAVLDVLAMLDRMASYCDVRLRHPFLDRRVVAFALAIPETQRWRGKTQKFVIRQAGESIIPQSVLARKEKTAFPDIQCEAILSALGGGPAAFPLLSKRQWICEKKLVADVKRMKEMYARKDGGYAEYSWPLWRVVAAESFLSSVE